ncbi:MAG: hypothetical protein EON91_13140 [Brevundimonas sp.]|uniref:hypothetical protein n=1 Tax=Brevundimonas sp. TaxID=1871086 RepID=UPI0011F8C941|nr:hypothetical protein [Brevundimonas sp.]RZJ16472.1 MAG: hypothetical protein EON91_13140 [Brevundimonas sp.]
MRVLLILSVLVGVACSAPPVTAQESESQFIARCRRQVVADDPRAAEWAHDSCVESWGRIAATGPMLDAFLPLFARSAAPTITPAALRAALPSLRWTQKGSDDAVASAPLGDLTVEILNAPPGRVRFGWSQMGEPIPLDPVEALRSRGARLTPVGCYAFGAGESNTVWRVDLPGHAPFALTVYRREAPTATAWSMLAVSVDADRRIPTLSGLIAEEPGGDWAAGSCE